MNVVSISWLFTFITLMYIISQLFIIGVAIFFWRRYPRPSLYLTIMATIEIAGSSFQSALQFMLNWGALQSSNMLLVQAMASSLRLAAHVLALCFLVAAVYVARRPSFVGAQGMTLPPGTPGMEGRDQAHLLDPNNPYTPPRQPR